MAKRLQTWSPDTCGCVLVERYDPDDASFIWECAEVKTKCTDHQSVPDNELYGVLHQNPDGENKRKNQARGALLEADGMSEVRIDAQGNAYTGFIGSAEMFWRWEGTGKTRKLIVRMASPGLVNELAVRQGILAKKATPSNRDRISEITTQLDTLRTTFQSQRSVLHQKFGPDKIDIE